MGELAMFYLAVGSVPAHWHRWVLKCTIRVGTIGVELALFVCLVGFDLSWTWMSPNTFGVFAGCSEGARIRHIDRNARWSGWRLVDIFAVFVGASQVEVTHRC